MTEAPSSLGFDTSRMLIDPYGRGMVWDRYPAFAMRKNLCSIDTFTFGRLEEEPPTLAELNMLIIFVAFMVDPGSPFYKERDFEARVQKSMEASGIDKTSLRSKVKARHWWYSRVLSDYLKLIHTHEFETWISTLMNYHEMMAYLRLPMTDFADDIEKMMNTREKIQKAAPGVLEQLKQLEAKIFPAPAIAETVSTTITADGIGGWAEFFAQDYDI